MRWFSVTKNHSIEFSIVISLPYILGVRNLDCNKEMQTLFRLLCFCYLFIITLVITLSTLSVLNITLPFFRVSFINLFVFSCYVFLQLGIRFVFFLCIKWGTFQFLIFRHWFPNKVNIWAGIFAFEVFL